MAPCQPRYVTQTRPADLLFSVCTLVASDQKYERMVGSFVRGGFNETNSEFIALDNRGENRFEGYSALRRIFPECRGQYILFVHDDVELLDEGADRLHAILRDLDRRDPQWAVAGNSGNLRRAPAVLLRHLSDPHGDAREGGQEPVPVVVLDENFLVLRRSNMVFPSMDLEGFHLFATDLCLQARMAGGHAYVIPFHLRHHGSGNKSVALDQARARMGRKYGALGVWGRIYSPASVVYAGRLSQLLRLYDEQVWAMSLWLKRIAARLAGARTGS